MRQLQKNEGALLSLYPGDRDRARARSCYRPARRRGAEAGPKIDAPEPDADDEQ